MKDFTDTSVSDIQDFHHCRRRWCFRHLDGRIPRRIPTAYQAGSLLHEAFQNYFNEEEGAAKLGYHLEALLPTTDLALLEEHELKAIVQCQNLVEPLNYWSDFYPVTETLEVEEAHEWTLDNGIVFHMRPDRVVMVNDYMFHMQHKSLAGSRNMAVFLDVAARSMHELLYFYGLSTKYPAFKNGGTIYNVVRKLQHKSKAKKTPGKILHEPHEFFCQQTIPIAQNLVDEALYDLDYISNEMIRVAAEYKEGVLPASNRSQDEDTYSKRTDPYFEVLMGRASLDDDYLFMDKEDRYAEAD